MPRKPLQVNLQPVLDLQRLIDLEGQHRVERELDVHRTTIQRWLNGQVKIPGAQRLAIHQMLGDLPGTEGAWRGWRFSRGELLSPDGETFGPGELNALAFRRRNGLVGVGYEVGVDALRARGRKGRRVEVVVEGQRTVGGHDRVTENTQ